jgi:hypothetical protein
MELLPLIALPIWVWTWLFFVLPLQCGLIALSRSRSRVARQQSEQRTHEVVMSRLALERLTGSRPEPAMVDLKISRQKRFGDRQIAYRVMVDQKKIGRIGNGESNSFSLASGLHEVHLEAGRFCRFHSPSLEVILEPGHTTGLMCQPHFAAWQAYWALLHPGEWIELTRED